MIKGWGRLSSKPGVETLTCGSKPFYISSNVTPIRSILLDTDQLRHDMMYVIDVMGCYVIVLTTVRPCLSEVRSQSLQPK